LLDERVPQLARSQVARVSLSRLLDGNFSCSFLIVIKEQFCGFNMGPIIRMIDFEIIEGPKFKDKYQRLNQALDSR
jgi:hypothetical protein